MTCCVSQSSTARGSLSGPSSRTRYSLSGSGVPVGATARAFSRLHPARSSARIRRAQQPRQTQPRNRPSWTVSTRLGCWLQASPCRLVDVVWVDHGHAVAAAQDVILSRGQRRTSKRYRSSAARIWLSHSVPSWRPFGNWSPRSQRHVVIIASTRIRQSRSKS